MSEVAQCDYIWLWWPPLVGLTRRNILKKIQITTSFNLTAVFSLSLALNTFHVWETPGQRNIILKEWGTSSQKTLIAFPEKKSASMPFASPRCRDEPELGFRLHAVEESLELKQVQPSNGGKPPLLKSWHGRKISTGSKFNNKQLPGTNF